MSGNRSRVSVGQLAAECRSHVRVVETGHQACQCIPIRRQSILGKKHDHLGLVEGFECLVARTAVIKVGTCNVPYVRACRACLMGGAVIRGGVYHHKARALSTVLEPVQVLRPARAGVQRGDAYRPACLINVGHNNTPESPSSRKSNASAPGQADRIK